MTGGWILCSNKLSIGVFTISLLKKGYFSPCKRLLMSTLRLRICVVLLCKAFSVCAQLDTIHWLPPMHARKEWGPEYLYLSTPEKNGFPVTITDGSGALVTTVTISNSQPYRYDLGSGSSTLVLVPENQVHVPITGKGLILSGPEKFYAYYRVHSASLFHAGDLTCKGRAGLGTVFRVGHLIQESQSSMNRSNFVGFMATEDSTVVSLSGFDPLTKFHMNGTDQIAGSPVQITLQKGQSAVITQYLGDTNANQPPNGMMGALLQATHPIAVNAGSWVGAPVDDNAHDIGIDQIAPIERMGKEYILCKGNGSPVLERPIVIAHYDNTKVWLNGNSTPVATLNAGQYVAVFTSQYSAAGNLYIRTSEPVFVYQMIGGAPSGADAERTAGLIFVPPISCGIPNAVDNIYQPNLIGTMSFDGGLMITAMKDSLVTVRIDGFPVSIGPPDAVPGIPEFVTYRKLDLFDQNSPVSTISVVAQGAVQVAMYGRNQPASYAAFYSGFSKTDKPALHLTLTGDGVCPDTLIAHGHFDGVQWMYEDSIVHFGPDTFLIAYAPGRYIATGYLGVCRRTDFAADTLDVKYVSPQFPYTLKEPSCFGFRDGSIRFGDPYGGFPPYQFSVDNGKNYSQEQNINGLKAGDYKLVVRDSTGCYNRPLEVLIGQPDSFSVHLSVVKTTNPLKPGDEVVLEAKPDRPVVEVNWSPPDSSGCQNCLSYTVHPPDTLSVQVTVYDTAGCPATDRLILLPEPNIFAPNVFYPGAPAENAYFSLFSRMPLPIQRLSVYDRWGEEVFRKENFYTNKPQDGWDGTFKTHDMNPGVYVFVATVEMLPGKTVTLKGNVTLVR
jgi:hypothetical protein